MNSLDKKTEILLRLRNIDKTFTLNRVRACQDISLSLLPGETVSLMGENGAGKSTLASILGGVLEPDRGTIVYKGWGTPGIVHQKPLTVDSFTVCEMILGGNTFLTGKLLVNQKSLKEKIDSLLERYDCDFTSHTKMSTLSPYQYQQVELMECLLLNKELIILDEPEFPHLKDVLNRLRGDGKTIIIITHKLEEAISMAERIIVMQRGKISLDTLCKETQESEVIEHLVWEEQIHPIEKSESSIQGEILVIAGLHESGLWEEEERLSHSFLGTEHGYLPSFARLRAMEGSWTTQDNLMIHKRKQFLNPWGLIKGKLWREEGSRLIKLSRLKAEPQDQMNHLSGGNQKKLLLLREMDRPGEKLLLCEPAVALDLVNRERLYNQLREARSQGKKITLLTSDPEEALLLGDIIIPLYKGKRGEPINRSAFTVASLSSAMRGRS